MLLWDPVAANTPVASVSVGRPVNSACFSTGDPYALICAPELGAWSSKRNGGGGGNSDDGSCDGNDNLVQIWDLRRVHRVDDYALLRLSIRLYKYSPVCEFGVGVKRVHAKSRRRVQIRVLNPPLPNHVCLRVRSCTFVYFPPLKVLEMFPRRHPSSDRNGVW